ncbi:dynamin family protein [Helicobacter cetorum]|uniref:dynamin family protein n=1 Tax=Helicobacter cetorum TaxID=138563 RepID=UPI000CF07B8D|nr:dynamin family protein [Helicobacter cetorum]
MQTDFIKNLLNAKYEQELEKNINEYHQDLEDYYQFAKNKQISLDMLAIKSLMQKIEQIIMTPYCLNKCIVAVGGGFSAGKSAFINSFLLQKSKIKLPIDFTPTTAIPTCISYSETEKLLGNSKKGSIDLSMFDVEINHDFLEELGFDLKILMPYLTLKAPIDYENLCFLDTPGYNPSKLRFAQNDSEISKNILMNTDIILWVVNAESGTLPKGDIEFLRSLDMGNSITLLIILNQSDKKSLEELEEIKTTIRDVLDKENIKHEGIIAYSSENAKTKKFYRPRKKIQKFLKSFDKSKDSSIKLLEIVNRIIFYHQDCFKKEIDSLSHHLDFLFDLRNRLFKENFDNLNTDVHKGIEKEIRKLKDVIEEKEQLLKKINEKILGLSLRIAKILNYFDNRNHVFILEKLNGYDCIMPGKKTHNIV